MDEYFDVWLMGFEGISDAQAVSVVQRGLGVDFEEAREILDSRPTCVKRLVTSSEARVARGALEDHGVVVKVLPGGSPPPEPGLTPIRRPVASTVGARLAAQLASSPPAAGDAAAAGTGLPSTLGRSPSAPSLGPPGSSASTPAPGPPKSGLARWARPAAVVVLLGGLAAIAWLTPGDEEGPPREIVDAEAAVELASADRAEARAWLASPSNTLMGVDPGRAAGLVDALYRAGAVDVQVVGVEANVLAGYAPRLLATLPEDDDDEVVEAARAAVGLDDGARPVGRDVAVRRGDRYLRVILYEKPARARGKKLWELAPSRAR